ncbi:unnamed protein product [Pleuronectes platessa]|uniref:Uncharacterized protein n=1 Tax=Pleuronectes platessa TaxID=8262 RepID=A0A9N7VBK9_PLEPL|nr:unnamed protein product [Pleuronectes platessa]
MLPRQVSCLINLWWACLRRGRLVIKRPKHLKMPRKQQSLQSGGGPRLVCAGVPRPLLDISSHAAGPLESRSSYQRSYLYIPEPVTGGQPRLLRRGEEEEEATRNTALSLSLHDLLSCISIAATAGEEAPTQPLLEAGGWCPHTGEQRAGSTDRLLLTGWTDSCFSEAETRRSWTDPMFHKGTGVDLRHHAAFTLSRDVGSPPPRMQPRPIKSGPLARTSKDTAE